MAADNLKTGISTLVDLDLPFPELCAKIAAAGFSHVSLSHSVEHAGYHTAQGRSRIAEVLEETGLELNYIHAPIQRYYDLTSLDEQVRRLSIEVVKMSVRATAELAGDAVVVHAINERSFPENELAQRVQAGILSLVELAGWAEEESVKISLENLPGDQDWHRLTSEIMHGASHPNLWFCLDTCHATIGLEEPLAFVRQIAPRVRTLHLSDTQGLLDSHLIPGEGKADFAGIAAELAGCGFHGVADLECSLWMLRRRLADGRPAPGDPEPCDTDEYLRRSQAAATDFARRIASAREA